MGKFKAIWFLFGAGFIAGIFLTRGGSLSVSDAPGVATEPSSGAAQGVSAPNSPKALAPSSPVAHDPAYVRNTIESGHGDELFDVLFSSSFREHWREQLEPLAGRLNSRWPSLDRSGASDPTRSEAVARLGIFKALARVPLRTASDSAILKRFILNYLETRAPRPWTLEREALRTLVRPGMILSESEKGQAIALADLRARSLASVSDLELLRGAIEKKAGL